MLEQARGAFAHQMHSEFAVQVQAGQDRRSARFATSLALTMLNIVRQLIEEVEGMAVIGVVDGGEREGALNIDGEAAAGLWTEEAEAVAPGAAAGGAGEVGRDGSGDKGVGRVRGVEDSFREAEARVVYVEAALLAAIGQAGALISAAGTRDLFVFGHAADHQGVILVAEVRVPHDRPGLMSKGWFFTNSNSSIRLLSILRKCP